MRRFLKNEVWTATVEKIDPMYLLYFLHKWRVCTDNRHMRFETIQTLKDEDFKRSTGISYAIFEKILTAVKAGIRDFG